MADLVISATPRKPLSVDLVGIEYTVRPPKGALAIVMAKKIQKAGEDVDVLLNSLSDWLKVAVGPKTAAAIMKRLDDPNDELDYTHLTELMTGVMEAASGGNPTT